MQQRKQRIAILAYSVDCLCIDWSAVTDWEPWWLVPIDSAEAKWVAQFLPAQRTLSYSSEPTIEDSNEALLQHSSIADVLKQAKIKALLFTDSITPGIQRWAQEEEIALVGVPFALQQRFENKVWFHQFLLENDLPQPHGSPRTLPAQRALLRTPCVIQAPNSCGGEQTYIAHTQDQLKEILDGFTEDAQYLVRDFAEGVPYGITMLMTDTSLRLSVPCRQCFYPSSAGPLQFAGIQFMDTATLSETLRLQLEKIFLQCGKLLHAAGYRGSANIDYIVTPNDDVVLLECNPRFTGASTNLCLFPSLSATATFGSDCLACWTQTPRPNLLEKSYGIPISRQCSSMLFLYKSQLTANAPAIQTRTSGTYTLEAGELILHSPDPRWLQGKEDGMFLFIDPDAMKSQNPHDPIVQISAAQPLFHPEGGLNEQGKHLLAALD